MPPTRYPHAEIIQRLITLLMAQIDQKKVSLLGSNFGLMISRDPLTCRCPDLALYWRDKMKIEDGLYWSPPDLIVEILSPSETRKRKEEKLADYASIGVPEAWLISPEAQSAEVRRLTNGNLETVSIQVAGKLQPDRFPGLSVALAGLWPD